MSFADKINPIALKELRQMVRSRFVASGLVGLLLIAMIAITVVLLNSHDELQDGIALIDQGLGTSIFTTIYVVMAILLLYAAPFFIAIRMGAERSNEHLDLQYTTSLTPHQLVDGKTAVAAIMVFFFLSAVLPFFALAYLLRGLDLLQAMTATIMLLMGAIFCIYEALFLAAVATTLVLRILLVVFMLAAQWSITGMVMGYGIAVINSVSTFSFSKPADITTGLVVVAVWITTCLFLRAVVIAAVTPSAANRAPSLRGGVMILWLIWAIIAHAQRNSSFTHHFTIFAWAFTMTVIFTIFALFSASSAPGYSRRVLSEVSPHSCLRRLLQFISFSGAENGMVWSLLMTLATLLVAFLSVNSLPSSTTLPLTSIQEALCDLTFFALTITAYVWTARLCWHLFNLHKRFSYKIVAIVAIIAITAGWALPWLVTIGSHTSEPAWVFGNIFAFTNETPDSFNITIAASWLLLTVILSHRNLSTAFARFKAPQQNVN